jgi:predicted RNase H-related nuclease YkuK (DUF458 family)
MNSTGVKLFAKLNPISLLASVGITLKHENKIEVLIQRLALEENKSLKYANVLKKLVHKIK